VVCCGPSGRLRGGCGERVLELNKNKVGKVECLRLADTDSGG
jgi:hypothetical protein